ncbi:MAG: efflux RND transporter periplasmic adaptor subunit [Bacteroidales bacterium]|nr:efflux RND transporter periplasmic adaptor subunit [Bacteroidales bacterium]
MKSKIIYAGIILMALAAISCKPKEQKNEGVKEAVQEEQEQRVQPVKIMKVTYSDIEKTEQYMATINPWETGNIGPNQPGKIDRILVDVGDRVKKGDLLVKMDPTYLIQAKLQFEDTKRDFARMDSLLPYGSVSQQVYDKTKMGYELAKTALQTLEENVNIRAPFDGIIVGKFNNEGELYSAAAPNALTGVPCIVALYQIDFLKVIINVSEKHWNEVKNNMEAEVTSELYPDKVFKGKVYKVYPTINAATKTFQVEIKVPNALEILRPGMFAKVTLKFGQNEAFIVPASAVLKQEGTNNRYVFIEEKGNAKRLAIIPGKRYDDKIEIISGIKPGQNLVIQGQSALMDGDPVNVVKE